MGVWGWLTDPANWKLIVNKQTGQSGMTYDKGQDLGRTPMTMGKPAAFVENPPAGFVDHNAVGIDQNDRR